MQKTRHASVSLIITIVQLTTTGTGNNKCLTQKFNNNHRNTFHALQITCDNNYKNQQLQCCNEIITVQ